MPDDLTDLLPLERQRALRREYLLRRGIVGAYLVAALAIIASVLLVPAYVYLSHIARAKEAQLAASAPSSAEDAILSSRVKSLENNAAMLMRLDDSPSASAVMQAVLAIPRSGITLTRFQYTPATGKKKGSLSVTGMAATRAALRNYQLALEHAPLFVSADLPVSAYAKETDSPFVVTLHLAP